MFLQRKKAVLSEMILVMFLLLLLLVACGCAGGNGSNTGNTATGSTQAQGTAPSENGATAAATVNTSTATVTPVATAATPQQVTPKAASGSAGNGPLVISSPTPVPGGKADSEQVVLGDRTLIITSVSQQNDASTNSTLVSLSLTVQNTSGKTIMNQSTFFQLVGSEGDIFGYQYNSSDSFYGTIAAHTNRAGSIVFQVPTAAASNLRLMYRPEIAAETTIVALIVS